MGKPLAKGKDWKSLYLAALFETDRAKLPQKIATAQIAISAQRRHLVLSGTDIRERHTLDNALFSLEALKNCLALPAPPPNQNEIFSPSIR